MTDLQIEYHLHHGPQTEKALGRLYLFACASKASDVRLAWLCQSIQEKLNLDETGFYTLVKDTEAWWQSKIDRMERLALEQAAGDLFEEQIKPAAKTGRISSLKARELLAGLITMILERWSIQCGSSHLKRRDLSFFTDLLQTPQAASSLLPALCHPIAMVWKGEWTVSREEYLQEILYLIRHWVAYLEAASENMPDEHLLESLKKTLVLSSLPGDPGGPKLS